MRRVPRDLAEQVYWRYIAPNEPRPPKIAPHRLHRRAQSKIKNAMLDPWAVRFDGQPVRLKDWRRGVWSTRVIYRGFVL